MNFNVQGFVSLHPDVRVIYTPPYKSILPLYDRTSVDILTLEVLGNNGLISLFFYCSKIILMM